MMLGISDEDLGVDIDRIQPGTTAISGGNRRLSMDTAKIEEFVEETR